MLIAQQYRLDALLRAQSFLDVHPDLGGGTLTTSAARRELDAAIIAIGEASHLQATSPLSMAAHSSRQVSLIRALKVEHMRPIATFARAKLRGAPDFAALTRGTARLSARQVVRAARAMATAAAPHAAVLTEAGFPADAVAQLEAAANAVENAYTQRGDARVVMVGATKAIVEQLRRGSEAVQILNGVLTKLLVGSPSLQAEWNAARRVSAKPGVPRGSTTVVLPVPPVTQTPAQTAAPDAQAA